MSPEWQIWQGPLPNFIPPESAGMTGFQQESQGHHKDLEHFIIIIVDSKYVFHPLETLAKCVQQQEGILTINSGDVYIYLYVRKNV